jgi:hypothetical protein
MRIARWQKSRPESQRGPDRTLTILKQAGRMLRNVIEGAIGSLLATAVSQTTIWTWVNEVMQRLFG